MSKRSWYFFPRGASTLRRPYGHPVVDVLISSTSTTATTDRTMYLTLSADDGVELVATLARWFGDPEQATPRSVDRDEKAAVWLRAQADKLEAVPR